MRFTFTAIAKPGHDIENLAVTFAAPTWGDARRFVDVMLEQIGYRTHELETWELVYARKIVLEPETQPERN